MSTNDPVRLGQVIEVDLEPHVVLEITNGVVTRTKPVRDYWLDRLLSRADPTLTLREARRQRGDVLAASARRSPDHWAATPPEAPSAEELDNQFHDLSYLNKIPLSVIKSWTDAEREEASSWASEWNLWTADICNWRLDEAPACLKPYLPPPEGTLKR
jgi:hypothetical protein